MAGDFCRATFQMVVAKKHQLTLRRKTIDIMKMISPRSKIQRTVCQRTFLYLRPEIILRNLFLINFIEAAFGCMFGQLRAQDDIMPNTKSVIFITIKYLKLD